jgi:hypothetical protein
LSTWILLLMMSVVGQAEAQQGNRHSRRHVVTNTLLM